MYTGKRKGEGEEGREFVEREGDVKGERMES